MKPTASLLTLGPVAIVLAMARPASAQSTPHAEATVHPASDALTTTLRDGVERERLVRVSLGLSGVALGAGLAGVGAMLVVDGGSQGVPVAFRPVGWTGIGVGGLLLTTSIVSLLMPGPMEALDRTLAEARRSGLDERAALEATERRWVALADQAHTARMIEGGAFLTGAVALGATGAAVVLAPPGNGAANNGGADARARVPLGVLLGAGAASFATAGVAMLTSPSEVEASLHTWRTTHSAARHSDVGLSTPTVSVADGGMVVGVGGTF